MALIRVWITPQPSGMPTKPQARRSLRPLPEAPCELAMLVLLFSGLSRDSGGFLLCGHVVLLVDRLDQAVGDEAADQQPGQHVHSAGVGIGLGNTVIEVVL